MRVLKHFLLVVLFVAPLLMFSPTYANDNGRGDEGNQDRDRDGGRSSSNCDTGTGASVPLDGGLVILLAAGFAFGVKKVIDAKRLTVSPNYLQ
jgi:hypothetical protein